MEIPQPNTWIHTLVSSAVYLLILFEGHAVRWVLTAFIYELTRAVTQTNRVQILEDSWALLIMIPASSAVFLNPDTYLNRLTPGDATDYETTRNVLFVLFGAVVWDILATLPDDIKVLIRSRLSFATICFIFSRCFSVAYVISHIIRRTMSIQNIYAASLSGIVLCGISIMCSSYLILQRTRAVYTDSPRVRRLFTIIWMAYILFMLFPAVCIKPAYIQGTSQFKDEGIQPRISLAVLVAAAYDSFVFLAISYKIGIAHVVIDREMGWKRFILGRALPRLSQAVLRGGQQYYLLLIMVLLPSSIVLYVPATPPIFKSTLVVFLAPLMATMSCRVHRKIKLFECDVTVPYPISEIQFL